MSSRSNAASEGLLSSTERWAPADAELWGRWRDSLSKELRSEALLPLQAVLSGLVAFRDLENQAPSAPAGDFHRHIHAVRVGYDWALQLIARLRNGEAQRSWPGGARSSEPGASLQALKRSLTDALRVNEQLLDLPYVDETTFHVSCDLFLRELRLNSFFQPPEPLEFSNAGELMRLEGSGSDLEFWESDSRATAAMISFLTLLRDHRFLGIADRQLQQYEGVYCAHIIAAVVRKELRTLSHFLLVQGVETIGDELGARLLSVEALATGIHAKSCSALDYPLPELDADGGHALAAQRMRQGIRELRDTVKDAAKQLRGIARPAESGRAERRSERVQRNLHQDIWAFRFILQAFIAKASVASLSPSSAGNGKGLAFTGEFLRHFRLLGLRLSRGTEYARSGALTRAVSALKEIDTIDDAKLDRAMDECMLFHEHLDTALGEGAQSPIEDFDKTRAAEELRGYLSAIKNQGH